MPGPTRVLANPRAGRGRAARLLRDLLAARGTGGDLDVRLPDGSAALTREARRAAEEGLERLIVVGGDGTVHHAVAGLAGSDTALGIVAGGTGNDLARALGLPLDPAEGFRLAERGPTRRIDLGRADGRPFAGIAALGFDSAVLERMRVERRLFPGSLAYAHAVARTLVTFRSPALRVDAPGAEFHGPAMLAVVANSPVFGGGMRIAPQAVLDDGWLDLVIIRPLGLLQSLRLFPRVYRGTHVNLPAVTCARIRRATLYADRAITVNGDGEPLATAGDHGTAVEIWPGALRVVTR